ncbi:MAG: T9SS type A sorting domain-containing protein, partial [Ignavibacteriae bacterium]|nr:T9SS type A sorting domain-containing protein [Ignavibacteriota bacterium]
ITDSIKAGKGYWVKASDAGKLILTSVTMSSSNSIKIIPTSEFPPPPPKGVLESWSNGVFPTEFALEQNYPNPFNPSTVIRYQLPVGRFAESPGGPDESSYNVSLKVYSILGEEVATLVNEKQDAGFKLVEFNSSGLSSGIYYYQLRSASIVLTRKLAVVK